MPEDFASRQQRRICDQLVAQVPPMTTLEGSTSYRGIRCPICIRVHNDAWLSHTNLWRKYNDLIDRLALNHS
jgi:hypothetical protein